jgi:hypothetical protein
VAVARTSASSSMASGTAGITATFGTGAAAGNLGILIVETANQTPGTPSGWTSFGLTGNGFGSAGSAGSTMLTVFYKNGISSGDISGGIAVADSGDHTNAILLTYSGFDTSTPIPVVSTVASNSSTSSTSFGSWHISSGIVTDCAVVAVTATDRDSNTAATLSGVSFINVSGSSSLAANFSSASGTGGGIFVHDVIATGNQTGDVEYDVTFTASAYNNVVFVIAPAVSSRTATLAKTLGTLTVSSAATVKIAATFAKTLGTLTASARGFFPNNATVSKTLGTLTSSSAATVKIQGTLAQTLGTLTTSSAAKLKITATFSNTLGTLTGSDTGQLIIKGSVAKTLGTLTVSSAATVKIVGTVSKTLGTLTSSSAGKLLLAATLNQTLGTLTSSSAATLKITGTLGVTLGTLTGSDTGQLLVKGSVAGTLGDVTLTSNGSHGAVVLGSLAATLDPLTSVSSGQLKISGSLTQSLDALSGSETAQLIIKGSVNKTLDTLTCDSVGDLATPITASSNIELNTIFIVCGAHMGPPVSTSLRKKGRLGEPINAYRTSKFIRNGRGYWTK